jgi:hypothetical protein
VSFGLGDWEEDTFVPDVVSRMLSFTGEGLPVKITTLDAWARHNDVDVGLIKVDIDGYAQRFLKGAIETIKKHRPTLLLSIYHSAADLLEIKPFIESLDLGYRFKVRRHADNDVVRDTMLICEAM